MSKVYFLLFLICLTAVISCKKKKSHISSPDNVDFQLFNPAPEITSVDSFHVTMTSTIPVPSDSSSNYLLDINSDSNPDFKLTVEHWYQFVSASTPEANYNYRIIISGIDSLSEIASTFNKTKFFSPGELISQQEEWANSRVMMFTGGSFAGASYTFSGTRYLGLRIKQQVLENYCWLKVTYLNDEHKLQIESFGYNQTGGNDIEAGQGE